MADDFKQIRQVFADAAVALGSGDVWSVQGATVVKHKALERLAAAKHIDFDMPIMLRQEREECVLIVKGALPTGANTPNITAWSIGEAVIGQNYIIKGKMQAYPYAMAEKRAKDRVVIKLCGLEAYSEEEADEFKEAPAPKPTPAGPTKTTPAEAYVTECITVLPHMTTAAELNAWWENQSAARMHFFDGDRASPLYRRLFGAFRARHAAVMANAIVTTTHTGG